VSAVTARGAEVRTLDEFFNRIIVVDRRLAIIPGRSGLTVALAVREPSLVAYLVDIFERHWERARPFTNRETSMMKDIAAEQRAMTIRMLIEGHADPASAKRLGVSTRTYAGYIADLKEEYEAETRFQLGYTMGRLGVSGAETHTHEAETGF
ncbi:MAG: LuxR family transcriptional regulator, partial [Nocardioides sp.]